MIIFIFRIFVADTESLRLRLWVESVRRIIRVRLYSRGFIIINEESINQGGSNMIYHNEFTPMTVNYGHFWCHSKLLSLIQNNKAWKLSTYQLFSWFFVFQVFYLFNLLDDAAGKNERAVSCRKTFEYSKVKTSEYDREYIYTKIKTIWKKIFMTKWVLACMLWYISYSIYFI